jgi:hypothetical protein
MRRFVNRGCTGAAVALIAGLALQASAATITATSGAAVNNADPDTSDAFENATIDSASPPVAGSFYTSDMFGTNLSAEQGHAIFADNNQPVDTTTKTQTNVTFVNFHTTAPVSIGGYNLYLSDDTGSGHRGVTYFRLYASNDGGSTYTVLLSKVQINPILDGPTRPTEADVNSEYINLYGSNAITVSDSFSTATDYQYFRGEFMVNPWVSPNGPRVIELDAVSVPEPASIGLLALGGAGLLTRRRSARL